MATLKSVFTRSHSDAGALWETLAKSALGIGILFVPLATFSWTSDYWETNKILVLLAVVSLAWVAYFVATLRRRQSPWRWHILDWFALGVGVATLLSAAFSVHHAVSWFGLNGWMAETAPAVLIGLSIYALVGQLATTARDRQMFLACLLTGLGLGVVAQMFQLSGVAIFSPALPSDRLFSLLSSSVTANAIVTAFFGAICLFFWTAAKEHWSRWAVIAGVTLAWLVLLFYGRPLGWAVFALGMFMTVWWQARQGAKASTGLIVVAVGLTALGLLAQLTKVASYSAVQPPTEYTLDQRTSASITWSTLKNRSVLGSGPETWYDNFVARRPLSFNTNPYWSIRFVKAASEWWQLLATVGTVGAALWFGTMLVGLRVSWLGLKRQPNIVDTSSFLIVGGSLIIGFFVTWSFMLMVLGWLALGLIRAGWPKSNTKNQPLGFGSVLSFSLVMLAIIAMWYPAVRAYGADILVRRAQNDIQSTKSLAHIQKTLQSALRWDRGNSDAAVLLANADATQAELSFQAGQQSAATTEVQQAVTVMRQAIAADPKNPAMYEAMNNLLNRLSTFVSDVETEARANFVTLQRLEPTNPIHDVGLGQTLLLSRTRLLSAATPSDHDKAQASKLLQQALASFDRAIQKKPDYTQAKVARTQALYLAGAYDQASTELAPLLASQSNQPPLWLEAGLILLKQNKLDKAKQAFDQAIRLDAGNPTVYSSVAQAYLDNGDKTLAKTYIDQGLAKIPGSSQLQQMLDKIK
ncbi:MAG: tetratricopeptide repeat protein [Candidatus Kerfeldbacteria bacterium]|nr:tetratricopeptide repeat protein [Candidatus Kerfeldbacteria bacterium]